MALTSSGQLAKSAVWNLMGTVVPLAAALFSIPVLIEHLGKDRFGLLALGWVLAGQLSIFDFGLGRGLTQIVASRLDAPERDLQVSIWTALVLMFGLGMVVGGIVGLSAPWFVRSVLKLTGPLDPEAVFAFRVLALGLPIVVSTTGLRGVLEAQQRFDLSNAVRIPMAVFTYLGPVFALGFSDSIVSVFAVLILGRALAWLAYLYLCLRTLPLLRRAFVLRRWAAQSLLRIGGWMAVSNLISPIMMYLDRFLIGSLVSVTAVAYYATPYEMVTKLAVISSAISGVLFPAFATSFIRDRNRALEIFRRGVKYVFLLLFPCVLVVEALSRAGLSLWLGKSFALASASVAQILVIGVFVNGLAAIPFVLLQGAGRPDLPAKLHMIELPCYLVCLWALTQTLGIEGAAVAWTLRVVVDMTLLYVLASRLLRIDLPASSAMIWVFSAAMIVLCAFAIFNMGTAFRTLLLLGALVAFSLVGRFSLSDRELEFLKLRKKRA